MQGLFHQMPNGEQYKPQITRPVICACLRSNVISRLCSKNSLLGWRIWLWLEGKVYTDRS